VAISSGIIGVVTYTASKSLPILLTATSSGLVFTALLNRLLKAALLRKEEVLSVRRLDAISVIEMTSITLSAVVSAILYQATAMPRISLAAISAGVALASFLGYAVRRVMMVGSGLVCLLSSTSPLFLSVLLSFGYTQSLLRSAVIGLQSLAVGVLMMELYRLLINNISNKVNRPFALFQSFVESLLEGKSSRLESELLGMSEENDIRSSMLLLRPIDKVGRPVALVVTEAHPGPFRNVGSSMLSTLMQRAFAKRGISAIMMKGLSSHEKNLASQPETERFCEELADAVAGHLTKGVFSPFFEEPRRLHLNGWSALTWKMSGKTVCVLTLHPKPMEDLPNELWPEDDGADIIPVDAHNSFAEGYTHLDKESVRKVKWVLESLGSSAPATARARIGYARVVPSSLGLAEGMGPSGISCLILEVNQTKTAIVVADGNNAVPWVRSLVQETAAGLGIDQAELCTTDTHAVNAVVLGGRGYHALGEVFRREDIRGHIETVLRKASEKMFEAEASFIWLKSSKYRIFSGMLTQLAAHVNTGARLFMLLLLFTPAVSALATFFLL